MQPDAFAQMKQAAEKASGLLKTISNEHRLLILCQLAEGEKSVGEIHRMIGLSQSPLSQHLARLRNEGLVKTRRESQTIFYSLASDEAMAVIGLLHRLYCEPEHSAQAEIPTPTQKTAVAS